MVIRSLVPTTRTGLGKILGKGKVGLAPKLELPFLVRALYGETLIGLAVRKQPHGVQEEFAVFLLPCDHQIPTHVLGQLEDRRLDVEGIQQQDIERAAAVQVQQRARQTERRFVFAVPGPGSS